MKLKYYLRGLGIGILVTALVLIIANHAGNKISDAEIIERAEALGMVMSASEDDTLFSSTTTEEASEDTTTVSEEGTTSTEENTETESESATEEVTEEVTEPVTEPVTEEVTEAPTTAASTDVVSYTLVISRGMYSEAVSSALQSAGIVANANEFNLYLVNAGYAEIIQTGTYNLNSGMTYDEIGRAITGR